MPYSLPELPYSYDALEPVISAEIMQLHHQKHHQSYVNNLNIALEKHAQAEAENNLAAMISLQPIIRFNGGGHLNHTFFWSSLAPPNQGGTAQEEFAHAINKQWRSQKAFIESFNIYAANLQGSGWCWLTFCERTGQLHIHTTFNQDPISGTWRETTPIIKTTPLLGIDMWEHAYYLQYKQDRSTYLKAIWEIVNWTLISDRYRVALETYTKLHKLTAEV